MDKEKIEPFYQLRAKEVVDVIFDKHYFKDSVTRDDMQKVEDFLAWNMQYQCQSAVQCALLINKAE